MKMIEQRKERAQQTWGITMLLSMVLLCAGNTTSADATRENHAAAPIRIVDQYGRQAHSVDSYVGGEIFDVTVGPLDNEFSFVPDTVNISVGDTVRWTWASDFHSVTSGTSMHRR